MRQSNECRCTVIKAETHQEESFRHRSKRFYSHGRWESSKNHKLYRGTNFNLVISRFDFLRSSWTVDGLVLSSVLASQFNYEVGCFVGVAKRAVGGLHYASLLLCWLLDLGLETIGCFEELSIVFCDSLVGVNSSLFNCKGSACLFAGYAASLLAEGWLLS